MDVILPLAFRLLLLVCTVAVSGWAILRAVAFRSSSWQDRVLAGLVAGMAAAGLTVTLLLLAGIYTRPVTILALAVPVSYIVWSYVRAPRPSTAALRTVAPELEPIDRAVIAAAACYLVIYFADAATSPLTWWDGMASWGKWAADWGRRTSSEHYVVGAYPQMVPRVASIMYKITGAHSDVLPLDFVALHAFYLLFAAWFLLAAVRLGQLLGIPIWPIALAGLGSLQFREHAGTGTVDVLLAAQTTTLLTLYLGHLRGTCEAAGRGPVVVFAAAVFTTVFVKWTGLVAVAFLCAMAFASRAQFDASPEHRRRVYRACAGGLVAGLVALSPFVFEQVRAEATIARWRPDPREVNISARQMPQLLSTDAAVVYRGGDTAVKAGLVQLRFWNSYDVPATLRIVFTGFLALCIAASMLTWFGRVVVPVVLIYAWVWLAWSSYDQRNLFVVLPVLALCAIFGTQRLWSLRPALLWKTAVALLCGVFLILTAGSVLREMQARIAAVARGDRAIGRRLAALRGTTEEKVDTFYPHLARDYHFLRQLAARTGAAHVLATSPLFRLFERGGHALSLWPYELVKPGDVFAAHEWHRPPKSQPWVLVGKPDAHTVWVLVPTLRDVILPEATDGEGRRRYAVTPEDFINGVVTWRGTVGPGGTCTPIIRDAGQVDGSLVSTAVETGSDKRESCSGLVGLKSDRIGDYRAGDVTIELVDPSGTASPVTLAVSRQDAPR